MIDARIFSELELRHLGIDKNLLIKLNDSGLTFDEIADYLDRIGK
jgi:hypothetical protein